MKKWIYSIVLLHLFCSTTLAQDNNGILKKTDISQYCHLDTLLSFKNETGGTAKHPVMASFDNRYVFTCYDARLGCDTIVIYHIHTDTYNVDTIRIYEQGISHYLQKNLSNQFKAVAIWDSLIVLCTYRRALVYCLEEDGSYKKRNSIKIPFNFEKAQMVDKHTILFVDAYHSRRKHRTSMYLYNIEKGKVMGAIHPYLNSTLNTYFSNMASADYRNGKIIWTHNNEYSFVEYNLALQQTDSTHYDEYHWHPLPYHVILKASKYKWTQAVDIMNTVQDKNVKSDMITWVLLLDDEQLMIIRKPHDSNLKAIDLWSKKTGKWRPSICNITDAGYWLNPHDTVRNHIQLGFSAGDYVSACGGKIVTLTTMGCMDSFDNLTGKEYTIKRDDYLLDNNYFLQLRIYTYDFGDMTK